jgi:hypothetical protein
MIAFWDGVPCSLVEIDWRSIGAYCLHHQGNGPDIDTMDIVEKYSISIYRLTLIIYKGR